MTIRLRDRGVAAVLLDIEGTTTPLAFVQQTLFPYARARLRAFLEHPRHAHEVEEITRQLAEEHAADLARGEAPPAWRDDDVLHYVMWLMDRDRKSPGLKRLQGLIWEDGYQAGELRGQVYDDVPGAIRRWREAGVTVAIYSSGSELAQRRLFESTPHGDLTPLMAGFFDTAVGAKVDRASYSRIAERLERRPAEILFLSDVPAELDAASAAGLQVSLTVRPGNPPHGPGPWSIVSSFDEIVV